MGKTKTRVPELAQEKQGKTAVIAVMNNKGGCGKTTTALALGMYLARSGNNVLFWDNDPQCNLTQRLGLPDHERREARLDKLFKDDDKDIDLSLIAEYPFLQRVHESKEPTGKIGMIPGGHMSETYATSLEEVFTKYSRNQIERTGCGTIEDFFAKKLERYKPFYNYVVIDTAPALEGNILNRLALTVTDQIVIPIDGIEAALGVSQLFDFMYPIIKDTGKRPNAVLAMVKYQFPARDDCSVDKLSRNAVFRVMKSVFGDFICDNGVRELLSLRQMTKSIPGFGGKTDYTEMSREIMEKIAQPRENIFDFVNKNGAISDLQKGLAEIETIARKRKPKFTLAQYSSAGACDV